MLVPPLDLFLSLEISNFSLCLHMNTYYCCFSSLKKKEKKLNVQMLLMDFEQTLLYNQTELVIFISLCSTSVSFCLRHRLLFPLSLFSFSRENLVYENILLIMSCLIKTIKLTYNLILLFIRNGELGYL